MNRNSIQEKSHGMGWKGERTMIDTSDEQQCREEEPPMKHLGRKGPHFGPFFSNQSLDHFFFTRSPSFPPGKIRHTSGVSWKIRLLTAPLFWIQWGILIVLVLLEFVRDQG